jgi:HSP20 family protein
MAKNDVELRKTDSIRGEMERLERAISQRAYDLFRMNGTPWGSALADWLSAERSLVWKPAVELRQKDNQFEVLAATAGVDPEDLDVQVTPDDLLIKGKVDHEHTAQEGDVHVCEFKSGQMFRSVHFPQKIDPATVKAEYKDGMLHLTAIIAKSAEATKVPVKAA